MSDIVSSAPPLSSDPAEVTVRPAEARDVPAIVALITRVLAEFGLGFADGSTTDGQLVGLPEVYTSVGGAFWVASDGAGNLLGTCGVYPSAAGAFELRKMYVAPEGRGLGLGKRLFAEAVAFARAAGGNALVLDTTEAMRQAIAFYERQGFARDDTQIRGARCSRGYRLNLEAPVDEAGA